jgi:hypothetical protein
MKRRLTFSTHAFAKKVLASTADWSCCVLSNMLYDRDPGGLRILGPRHVAAWVRRQYLDEDVFDLHADDRGGHVLALVGFPDGPHVRRKAMAERLLAAPDRRASITVDL